MTFSGKDLNERKLEEDIKMPSRKENDD